MELQASKVPILKTGSRRSKLCLAWNFLHIEILTFQSSNQHYLRCVVSDINGVLGGDVLAARRITSPVADWPVTVVARAIFTATAGAVSTAISGSITTAIIGAQSTAIAVSTAIATGVTTVVTTHIVEGRGFRWTARRCF